MSTPAEPEPPILITRFDGVRVPSIDYQPVWINSLADPGHAQCRRGGAAHRGQLPTTVHSSARVWANRRALRSTPIGEHFSTGSD